MNPIHGDAPIAMTRTDASASCHGNQLVSNVSSSSG
jgi:hypothetical protein